ncbi:hypothetical protein Patl1_29812 [Pistacia atlantica]|uniref:Uncharacterized protein n=1 Tax=Pistacia atlantica TaxID=434234 RepID=A0ACC1A820_9ROSI|nr:hypothetical protein Patl1_29812 [Pistacia atlantica]
MADDHSTHPDSTEIEMPDEYGGQESVAAKTIDDQVSESIATKLAHLKSTSSSRHIFKVPEHLRKGNEKAYEPYMLAIGPYHREKPEVQEMEEHKKEYLKELLERRGKEALNRYVTAMRNLEEQARSCYADDFSDIDTKEFVEMMLLDGCFIIELLRRFMDNTMEPGDSTADSMDNTMESGDSTADSFNFLSSIIKRLGRDLLLIENQIPFIVLEELFRMTTMSEQNNLHQMVLNFFADSVLPDQSKVRGEWAVCVEISTEKSEHQHLLSFIHDNWLREENWRSSRLVKQKLNDFVTLSPDNYYYDIFVRVNKYSAHSRHTWIANLRHKYFNSPWALISFFAAVLLLLFTLTQTVYSVLAYYK